MAATGRQQPKKRFVLLIDQPKKKGGGNRRRRQRCRLLPVPIRRHSRGESTPTPTHTVRIFCVRIAVKVTRAEEGNRKRRVAPKWHFASSSSSSACVRGRKRGLLFSFCMWEIGFNFDMRRRIEEEVAAALSPTQHNRRRRENSKTKTSAKVVLFWEMRMRK